MTCPLKYEECVYSSSFIANKKFLFRLQRTRLENNLSVPRPDRAETGKFHNFEFNFGEYPSWLYLVALEQIQCELNNVK